MTSRSVNTCEQATTASASNVAAAICEGTISNTSNPSPASSGLSEATTSIIRYFSQSFDRPREILNGLAQSNCILSGPRAAAFFFPCACQPDSEWAFYVPAEAHCVGAAIEVLSNAGVRWDVPWQKLQDMADAEAGTIFDLELRDYITMKEHIVYLAIHFQSWEHPYAVYGIQDQINEALEADSTRPYIRLESGVVVRMAYARDRCAYKDTSSMNIVTGHTTYNETSQKVQLIFDENKSPLDQIFDFCASQVQACVTGFGAFHLYYDLAAMGKAWYWIQNAQNKKIAEAATLEYAARGYTFTVAANPNAIDHYLNDPAHGAKFLPFDQTLDIPRALEQQRRAILAHLTWREVAGQTIWLNKQLTVEMEEVLRSTRRRGEALKKCNIDLSSEANFRTAVQYCTLFKLNSRSHGVNEVSGF